MLDALKVILEIQELDMKMIQLVQLRSQRQKEQEKIKIQKGSLHKREEEKAAEDSEVVLFFQVLGEKIDGHDGTGCIG